MAFTATGPLVQRRSRVQQRLRRLQGLEAPYLDIDCGGLFGRRWPRNVVTPDVDERKRHNSADTPTAQTADSGCVAHYGTGTRHGQLREPLYCDFKTRIGSGAQACSGKGSACGSSSQAYFRGACNVGDDLISDVDERLVVDLLPIFFDGLGLRERVCGIRARSFRRAQFNLKHDAIGIEKSFGLFPRDI